MSWPVQPASRPSQAAGPLPPSWKCTCTFRPPPPCKHPPSLRMYQRGVRTYCTGTFLRLERTSPPLWYIFWNVPKGGGRSFRHLPPPKVHYLMYLFKGRVPPPLVRGDLLLVTIRVMRLALAIGYFAMLRSSWRSWSSILANCPGRPVRPGHPVRPAPLAWPGWPGQAGQDP